MDLIEKALSSRGGDSNGGFVFLLKRIEGIPGGRKSLVLRSDSTPLVRDVILASEKGKDLLFLDARPFRAKGSGEVLEARFWVDGPGNTSIICAAECMEYWNGYIKVFESGRERKVKVSEPREEDRVSVELDGKSLGWEGKYALRGKELFGEAKAIVYNGFLGKGFHVLKIKAMSTPRFLGALVVGPSVGPPCRGRGPHFLAFTENSQVFFKAFSHPEALSGFVILGAKRANIRVGNCFLLVDPFSSLVLPLDREGDSFGKRIPCPPGIPRTFLYAQAVVLGKDITLEFTRLSRLLVP